MKKTVVLALAAIMVLGVAGAAMAGTSVIPGVAGTAQGVVSISAQVNPKLTLTLDTPDGASPALQLNWVIDDPDVAPASKDVDITVDSNKQFDLAVAEDFSGFTGSGITVSNTLAAGENNIAKGKGVTRTDTVSLTSADWWQVDPTTYTGTITYTVTQD